MPRFLDTSTGQFVWRDTEPGTTLKYAVLSHLWSENEHSYHDLRRLQAEVTGYLRTDGSHTITPVPSAEHINVGVSSIFSHPLLSDKVKNICRIARGAGYRLLWIDACCVDRTSNWELAETVHLTYELVQHSAMCYVYLRDVSDDEGPDLGHTRFRSSRWHTRSWTLQELIAPERVVFLSQTWRVLGTKTDLAPTLERITGVDLETLVGKVSLNDVSVAKRMSWAARRSTTRLEDLAYSLWGIFGVHMSPLYGEGGMAFFRLQKDIIKTTLDHSIFAWGPNCTISVFPDGLCCTHGRTRAAFSPCLLASSPADFYHSTDIVPLTSSEYASRLAWRREDIPEPGCIFTPEGVRAQLLCVDLTQVPRLHEAMLELVDARGCEECTRRGPAHTLALLQCSDYTGSFIALPLCNTRSDAGDRGGLAIATHLSCGTPPHDPFRVVRLSQVAIKAALQYLYPRPIDICFPRHAPDYHPGLPRRQLHLSAIGPKLHDSGLHFDLRHPNPTSVPLALEAILYLRNLKFTISPLHRKRSKGRTILTTSLVSDFPHQSGVTDGQHLQLRVILTAPVHPSRRAGANFSVVNYIHTPAPDPTDGISSPGCGHPPRHIIKKAPSIPGSNTTYNTTFDTEPANQDRVLAEAEFIVHADANWENDHNVRRLTFTLTQYEVPIDSGAPGPEFATNCILSVELSKRYQHGSPTTVDGNTGLAAAFTQTEPSSNTSAMGQSQHPRGPRILSAPGMSPAAVNPDAHDDAEPVYLHQLLTGEVGLQRKR